MPQPPRRPISRFIVMAILQAARARRLGLSLHSAYSWGLNRAIFYAAAKQGFKEGEGRMGEGAAAPGEPSREPYTLGKDFAYRDPTRSGLYFTIGGETQTENEFNRQIAARFGNERNFSRAWTEATAIVDGADLATLESGSRFYEQVYKPRRDSLRSEWSEMIGVSEGTGSRRTVPKA